MKGDVSEGTKPLPPHQNPWMTTLWENFYDWVHIPDEAFWDEVAGLHIPCWTTWDEVVELLAPKVRVNMPAPPMPRRRIERFLRYVREFSNEHFHDGPNSRCQPWFRDLLRKIDTELLDKWGGQTEAWRPVGGAVGCMGCVPYLDFRQWTICDSDGCLRVPFYKPELIIRISPQGSLPSHESTSHEPTSPERRFLADPLRFSAVQGGRQVRETAAVVPTSRLRGETQTPPPHVLPLIVQVLQYSANARDLHICWPSGSPLYQVQMQNDDFLSQFDHFDDFLAFKHCEDETVPGTLEGLERMRRIKFVITSREDPHTNSLFFVYARIVHACACESVGVMQSAARCGLCLTDACTHACILGVFCKHFDTRTQDPEKIGFVKQRVAFYMAAPEASRLVAFFSLLDAFLLWVAGKENAAGLTLGPVEVHCSKQVPHLDLHGLRHAGGYTQLPCVVPSALPFGAFEAYPPGWEQKILRVEVLPESTTVFSLTFSGDTYTFYERFEAVGATRVDIAGKGYMPYFVHIDTTDAIQRQNVLDIFGTAVLRELVVLLTQCEAPSPGSAVEDVVEQIKALHQITDRF